MNKEQEYNLFFLRLCVGIALATFVFVAGYHYGLSKFDAEVTVDTVHVTDTVWKSYPVLVESEPVVVTAPVDTDAIIQQFFTMNVFRDTLVLKEYGTVNVTDTVFENRIIGRQFTYDLSFPTFTAVKRTKFDVGAGGFFSRDAYGLVGSVKVKHWLLTGGYDFCNKSPMVGAQYMFGK